MPVAAYDMAMDVNDYCRQKAAPEGSSLYYSTLYLDPQKRRAILALHAFQKEISDVTKSILDAEPAQAKLAWWRMEIGALFEQHASHPVTRALSEARQHFTIAKEPLLEIINGFEMDIHHRRYDNFEALKYYCHRVSGTVSKMSSEITGYVNSRTPKFAHELALALHLTDIIRNVGLDARHGRIYLPLDEMENFDICENEIFDARFSDNVKNLLVFQTERARAQFDTALAQLAAEDRKTQRSALALANIQRALLKEIALGNYQVLDRSTSLTPLRMLWIASRTWLH